jgi:hypothetical protein
MALVARVTILEAEIGKMMVSGQPGQKSFQDATSMGKKLGMVAHACHPSEGGKHKIGGLPSRQAWTKTETISLK